MGRQASGNPCHLASRTTGICLQLRSLRSAYVPRRTLMLDVLVAAAALTAPQVNDAHPAWSHDGRYVAFDRTRRLGDGSTNASIVLVRRDGRGFREITPTAVPFDAVRPVWSDDGEWLAFDVGSDLLPTTVQWERRNRRSANSLLTGGGLFTTGAPPSWSRDGRRLAVAGSLGGTNGVYVVGRDTNRVHRVAAADAPFVAWSPDGHRIAFADSRSLPPLGPGHPRVTRLRAPPARLAWSPDGTRVAYAAGCAVGIVSADAAGRPPALAPCPPDVESSTPSWSPDGRRIAYSVCRRPLCSVFVAPAIGTT